MPDNGIYYTPYNGIYNMPYNGFYPDAQATDCMMQMPGTTVPMHF